MAGKLTDEEFAAWDNAGVWPASLGQGPRHMTDSDDNYERHRQLFQQRLRPADKWREFWRGPNRWRLMQLRNGRSLPSSRRRGRIERCATHTHARLTSHKIFTAAGAGGRPGPPSGRRDHRRWQCCIVRGLLGPDFHRLDRTSLRLAHDAVGTRITERPPRRSVRAAFPHTAPTSGPNGNCLPHAFQRL